MTSLRTGKSESFVHWVRHFFVQGRAINELVIKCKLIQDSKLREFKKVKEALK